jgi:quercetin dioxygenase-like cupin family protein
MKAKAIPILVLLSGLLGTVVGTVARPHTLSLDGMVSRRPLQNDLASVAPEHCKLLKEDAKVRVIHCILKKGDKVGMHSHPPFVVYFIKGGKSRYTLADGTTRDVETKNDEAQILPPVTHSGEQLDDVDEILVELKQ